MTLSRGKLLGPYEIVEPLGSGGMGEVYLARDTRLGRDVAIKVLPEEFFADSERLRRFEQEARAASALNHPNIVTIYDVGREGAVSYMTMELVGGRSLRETLAGGPLVFKRALAIGAQVADGLALAHASGIVHRDLKPENVMVTDSGLVKILDFGLAKLSQRESPSAPQSEIATVTRQTEPGVILGTVGYMSPEQASGKPADFRSDQFSLGAILYEMASGVRPFQRPTPLESLSAIIKEEPPPLAAVSPATPEPMRWIIERCLAKEPEARYASTLDLARDLQGLSGRRGETAQRLTAPAAPGRPGTRRRMIAAALALVAAAAVFVVLRSRRPLIGSSRTAHSVAILPFQNFGGSPEDEYFSDGMTESLITDLAKVKGLLVIARNSAFQYKKMNVDVQRVGADLRVRYILEGSVQRAGDSVRVNAQLIDAETGYHLWAEKYDRPMKDLFALQDDISKNIVGALKLTIALPAVAKPTSSLEAYDNYLRGRFYLSQFGWDEKQKSVPFFQRALRLDPEFALARASLAAAYWTKAFEYDPDRSWEQKASVEVEKALAVDPNLADAYLVRGSLSWTLANHFPHEKAAADFHHAIELNPNLAAAHGALGSLYYHVGLFEKALGEYASALKADPHNLDFLYRIPRIRLYQQDYAKALADFDATRQFADDFLKPLALDHLGRSREALALAERQQGLKNPSHSEAGRRADAASTYAVLLARAGRPEQMEQAIAISIRNGQGNSHFHHAEYNIATAYALMEKKKEALQWLEKTAEDGMPCSPLFESDPYLKSLRRDPEFLAFLARMKTQWERFRATL